MFTKNCSSIFELLDQLQLLTPYRELWFRGTSNIDYGLVSGLIWRNQTRLESGYTHEFLVGYQAYTDAPITNPWECYALMQHHGLPTRLLDWSTSPLSALFFALNQEPEKNTDRVVWMLDPAGFNKLFHNEEALICPAIQQASTIPFNSKGRSGESFDINNYLPTILHKTGDKELPKEPIAIDSPYSNKRLIAQAGCFTLHGSNSGCLVDQIGDAAEEDRVLSAFILETKDKREDFLIQLDSLGVNEATIYQDLDAMVRNINRRMSIAEINGSI